MKRLVALLATGICLAALAQEPPDGGQDPASVETEADTTVDAPPAEETEDEEAPGEPLSAEEDFNPNEEISEDYPVPLPSDI
jgi:hypothetical protein